MTHQSYYRTYRPQSFGDVVGQQHVVRTLTNALAEEAVAHAYLFTGPRGTGKTTVARILAKALNCPTGLSADGGATCQDCSDIAEGRHPDVYELDAASRTQVDNVREEIIGRLAYAPIRGTWKVYIIDEVHMLSNHSFNALLKTLEEPPRHTVFVLCTTHPHKVPDTIHSRCQRLDFHRIGVEDIVGRLEHICAKEGITVAEGSLMLIARHAAGGMRDAITTLEQLSAFTSKSITLEDVEKLLGEVDVALLFELADIVTHRDIVAAFRFVARIAEAGVDMTEFVRDFTAHVRDLYVTSVAGDASGIVDTTTDQLARLTTQARGLGSTRLVRILDLLGVLAGEIRWSSNPRLTLEVSLTRMASPDGDLTLEALAERVEALETGSIATRAPAAPAPAPPSAPPAAAEKPAAATPAAVASSPAPAPPVTPVAPVDRAHVKRAWPAVVAEIKRLKPSRSQIFANTEVDMDPDGKTIVIEFPADGRYTMDMAGNPDTRQLLLAALGKVFGSVPPLRYQLGRGPVRPAAEPVKPSKAEVAPAKAEVQTTASPSAKTELSSPAPPPRAEAPPSAPNPEVTSSSENVIESEVEQMLMAQLGAQMIAEHPHPEEKEEG